jgi:hypothetical protein
MDWGRTKQALKNLNNSCISLTEDDGAKVSDISFGVDKKQDDEYNAPDEYNTVYKFALLLLETIQWFFSFMLRHAC